MQWHNHYNLKGTHAFLSPSQYAWVNYDEPKLDERIDSNNAILRGTRLHEYAEIAIRENIRQPRTHSTLNDYINDGIGYQMDPEVTLYYSKWIYGTCDTISFRKEPKISKTMDTLRIHDLKTGVHPAKLTQLEIYAALFCLEYNILPSDIAIVLRIYQFDDILEGHPTSEHIVPIMDKIKRFSSIIEQRMEGER